MFPFLFLKEMKQCKLELDEMKKKVKEQMKTKTKPNKDRKPPHCKKCGHLKKGCPCNAKKAKKGQN